jgi:hypothetical protein
MLYYEKNLPRDVFLEGSYLGSLGAVLAPRNIIK